MIRAVGVSVYASRGVPRASGDDPSVSVLSVTIIKVFPAQAGMIPDYDITVSSIRSVPRASGDDPIEAINLGPGKGCSPRKRG